MTCDVAKHEAFHPTPNKCKLKFHVQDLLQIITRRGLPEMLLWRTNSSVDVSSRIFPIGENIPQTEFPAKLVIFLVSVAIQV